MIIDQIQKGFWPMFTIRTPGYPLFLWFIFAICKKNIALAVAQNLLSLLVPLFFIFVCFRISRKNCRWLPILTAIALGAFVSSGVHLVYDTTMMTDSLGTNSLLFAFALLMMGIYDRSRFSLFWASLAMAVVILIRPAGIFLIAIYLLVILFLFIHRQHYVKKSILFFALPFFLILLLFALYNSFTIKTFAISTFSEHALISYTSMFLEKDDSFSPTVNAIIEKIQARMTTEEHKTLAQSWDLTAISPIFFKYYNNNRIFITLEFLAYEKNDEYNLYLKWRPIWKRMALHAIFKHPDIYLKLFLANMRAYFYLNCQDMNFCGILTQARKKLPAKVYSIAGFADPQVSFNRRFNIKNYALTLNDDFAKDLLKEYYPVYAWQKKYSAPPPLARFQLKNSFWQRGYQGFQKLIRSFFRNVIWTILFLIVAVFTFIRLIRTRFHHRGAFVFFLLAVSAILNAVMACMSVPAIVRYSYPLEFVLYLSAAFLPLIIRADSWTDLNTIKRHNSPSSN
jgi:hypothetical protein